MHIASEYLSELEKKRSGVISESDRLCVMVAALVHDLGHGPMSHLWEEFLREARPETRCHEKASITLFDQMIEENQLLKDFQESELTEFDIVFIKGKLDQIDYNNILCFRTRIRSSILW